MTDKTSDLVCRRISSELKDKILENSVFILFLLPPKGGGGKRVECFISSDGSDSTGNGSESAPYATLPVAIQRTVVRYNNYDSYRFYFLSDYLETKEIQAPRNKTIVIDSSVYGNTHNVHFDALLKSYNGIIYGRGLVFNAGLDVSENSFLVLDGPANTFNLSSTKPGLIVRYGSQCQISSSLTINATAASNVIYCSNQSRTIIRRGTHKLTGSSSCLFNVTNGSSLLVSRNASFSASNLGTFKKYSVSYGSQLLTDGRGESFFPEGMTEGTKDDTSQII